MTLGFCPVSHIVIRPRVILLQSLSQAVIFRACVISTGPWCKSRRLMMMPNSDRFSCLGDGASFFYAISRDTPEHLAQALHVDEFSSCQLGLLLSNSCIIGFTILSLHPSLWIAAMHVGIDARKTFSQTGRPFVAPCLSTSTLRMYIRLVLILAGSSVGASDDRSSVLSRIIHSSISSPAFALRCHGGPFILLTKSAPNPCPQRVCELSALVPLPLASVLMQRLQLVTAAPHYLFSLLHHCVAVTLVLDLLIRFSTVVNFLVSRDDHSCT